MDRQFSVVFSDGYPDGQNDPPKSISGKVFFIEKDNLLWIKEIERPTNAAVSDNGTVALLYSLYRDSASSLSSKEFLDFGGTLTVIEKSGKTLFTYDFGSHIEGCAITRDGGLVSVGTLYPDNSVYCFYVGEKKSYHGNIRPIIEKTLPLDWNLEEKDYYGNIRVMVEETLSLDWNLEEIK